MQWLEDIQAADPFPRYDAEVGRLRGHLGSLDAAGWEAPSHCQGWSVRDVLSHLAAGEIYNQACLDGTLDELDFKGGIDGWNARAVAERRSHSPADVLREWSERQAEVRQRWGRLGSEAQISTAIGEYPLRLQLWHLAQEYATHADDVRVPVPSSEVGPRLAWRCAFGLFAREEEGRPLDVQVTETGVVLEGGGSLEPQAFLAFLTERPQHLDDASQRRLVEDLLREGR